MGWFLSGDNSSEVSEADEESVKECRHMLPSGTRVVTFAPSLLLFFCQRVHVHLAMSLFGSVNSTEPILAAGFS